MPINQPPVERDDPIKASWELELTQLINQLEQQLLSLQARVQELEDNS